MLDWSLIWDAPQETGTKIANLHSNQRFQSRRLTKFAQIPARSHSPAHTDFALEAQTAYLHRQIV